MIKQNTTCNIGGHIVIRLVSDPIYQRMNKDIIDMFIIELTKLGYDLFGPDWKVQKGEQNQGTTILIDIKFPDLLANLVNMVNYNKYIYGETNEINETNK